MPDRPAELIAQHELRPHPEGGWYVQVHRSTQTVQPADGRPPRNALTAIYFLLKKGEKSRWHRVQSDEIWTLLEGGPLHLHTWESGGVATKVLDRATPLLVVPAGQWQAAEPTGEYAFVACFVGPGFDFEDFALIEGTAADEPALPAAWRRLA
ncbi:MAG: cupin domain-containing protein [Acidobacteria bacterium]|nr:cupin domain-containing protein [Acidobacteriota bacterium]